MHVEKPEDPWLATVLCVCALFAGAERSGREIRKDLGSPIVSIFLTLDLEPRKMASDTCISPKNVGDDGLTD
jgi:hypothetical protein